jgi:nitroimidazol reductase NimA-like FMN-containing flavoprotein (pyridoxamine 5'-phosphate oxidase superfamily)
MSDQSGLEKIDEEECLELLASQSLGRLAVVHNGQPLVLPATYFLDERTVACRTVLDVMRDAAILGRVAFEVDSVHPELQEGWTVSVIGVGQHITDALDSRSQHLMSRARQLPWVTDGNESWVEIVSPVFGGLRRRLPPTGRPRTADRPR